jgi:hypothetical protein
MTARARQGRKRPNLKAWISYRPAPENAGIEHLVEPWSARQRLEVPIGGAPATLFGHHAPTRSPVLRGPSDPLVAARQIGFKKLTSYAR